MIDEENDPVAISSFFADVANRCFGNGIAVANSLLGPNVRPSMELACEYSPAVSVSAVCRSRTRRSWS
jgi:hypothetical protein